MKCRLIDSNPEIVFAYCRLLKMMIAKGITAKLKMMKSVLQTIYNNLSKGYPALRELLKEMVYDAPTQMFMTMQTEIFSEGNR